MANPDPQIAQMLNAHAQAIRQADQRSIVAHQAAQKAEAELRGVRQTLEALSLKRDGGEPWRPKNGPRTKGWQGSQAFIDDIPGARVPYDFSTSVLVAAGQVSVAQGTLYVPTDGIFVACRRYAVFESRLTFQYTSEGGTAAFNGRSWGRYRPISSHGDIMDAQRAFAQPSQYQPSYVGAVWDSTNDNAIPVANPAGVHAGATGLYGPSADTTNLLPNYPGFGRPIFPSPFGMAAFRTMQYDGKFIVSVNSTQYRRQLDPNGVPSSFWGKGLTGDSVKLCSPDVFNPGETVTIQTIANHPNNPEFGNIQGLVLRGNTFTYDPAVGGAANSPAPSGGSGGWPFQAGQYDGHEGIDGETIAGDSATTPDRVERVPDGVLLIGFQGYMILPDWGGH